MRVEFILMIVPRTNKKVEICGRLLRVGTSLYVHENDRVAWVEDISEKSVTLQALDTTIEIEFDILARHIQNKNISIESQPPV